MKRRTPIFVSDTWKKRVMDLVVKVYDRSIGWPGKRKLDEIHRKIEALSIFLRAHYDDSAGVGGSPFSVHDGAALLLYPEQKARALVKRLAPKIEKYVEDFNLGIEDHTIIHLLERHSDD